jgi:hypothetical protein
MATKAEEYEGGLRELAECRWGLMRKLADHREEDGDPETAEGLRWLAEFRRWPHEMNGGERAVVWYAAYHLDLHGEFLYVRDHEWWDQDEENNDYIIGDGIMANYLPASVFEFLPDGAKRNAGGATGARYGTLAEAIDKAARAVGQWLRAGRAANTV